MDNLFLQNIQKQVSNWRENGYEGVHKETENIIRHIRRVSFLHNPQIEALETYIFLKEVLGNKPSVEIFRNTFENELDFIKALGISKEEALELAYDKNKDEKIQNILDEKFGTSDYANQVYALTMGSGKTILMAVMMLYDFVLSYYHKDDERFAKNALVFAPDTTIIESLKEIKTFDYSKVLPKEYENIILNIKYHYLESTDTALAPVGNYNVIVSNSQKIILKTRHNNGDATSRLFGDKKDLEKKEVENMRLQAIRQLNSLHIFVDEAHHSYGTTLEGTLKKTRQTIDYLHEDKPLVSVVNLTGTPYVKNKMISDVVYHFGLKQGIERGILKQVRILDYGDVRSQKFLEEVVDTFISEYGTKRLEGRLPKIAFYASNIDDLRKDLKPKIEKLLIERGLSTDALLEYHTEAEENKEDFKKLDTIDSNKQFILLVGKGTEGWNCRSLVSVALYKKPKSTILVLQSTTRCMRSIGDNSTKAHIFLSKENYKILDKELKNNFASSIEELNSQDQEMSEHTLKIEKKKKIKVKKVLKDILEVKETDPKKVKIDFNKFKPEQYQSFVSEGGISISDDGKAGYSEAKTIKKIEENNDFTFYEIAELINRHTHLSFMAIDEIIEKSGKTRDDIVKMANKNIAVIPFIIQEILKNVFEYSTKEEVIEEEIELAKVFPFKISVQKGRESLVVYKEAEEDGGHKSRIGFHINPYAFDSGDEKDLLRYLRDVLNNEEAVKDVYFTGARVCSDPSRNDFYFEYWSPEEQKVARYFPDFLIETNSGRYIVIETKGSNEKSDYEYSKANFKGDKKKLRNEIYAKELGFNDFQKLNKNFEYKIIFDASLQSEQVKLFEDLKKK